MSATTIWNAFVAALSAIDGSGDYTNDVSGTGQIVEGAHLDNHRFPALALFSDNIEESYGPELGNFRRTLSARIIGYAEYTADTGNARLTSAMSLYDDVTRAIRTARTGSMAALVNDIRSVSMVGPINGAQLDVSIQGAIFVAEVRMDWFEDGTP